MLIPVLTQAKLCPVSLLPPLHCRFSLVPSSVATLGFFPSSFRGFKYRNFGQAEVCNLINHQILMWKIRDFFPLSSSRYLTCLNVFNAHCPNVNQIYKGNALIPQTSSKWAWAKPSWHPRCWIYTFLIFVWNSAVRFPASWHMRGCASSELLLSLALLGFEVGTWRLCLGNHW